MTWWTKIPQNFKDKQNESRIPVPLLELSTSIPRLFPYICSLQLTIRLWRYKYCVMLFTAVEILWQKLLPDPKVFSLTWYILDDTLKTLQSLQQSIRTACATNEKFSSKFSFVLAALSNMKTHNTKCRDQKNLLTCCQVALSYLTHGVGTLCIVLYFMDKVLL